MKFCILFNFIFNKISINKKKIYKKIKAINTNICICIHTYIYTHFNFIFSL